MRILIVEDEQKTATYLQRGLTESGFVADVAAHGDDGLHLAVTENYDLMILDVELPGRDGWSVLSALRQAGRKTPVVFLTARDAVSDRVKGLELGADDYLVKPFAFSELLARVRTIQVRTSATCLPAPSAVSRVDVPAEHLTDWDKINDSTTLRRKPRLGHERRIAPELPPIGWSRSKGSLHRHGS